jgi:Zn-dependent protease
MGLIAWLNFPIPQIPVILFVLGGWVASVCLHEFGHAAVGFIGGDSTVVGKGYLTLNPLKYTHRLLSIILPILFLLLGGIPLPGGAVYIDRSLIRTRKMLSLMSAAGPGANLAIVLLMLIPYHIFSPAGSAAHQVFWGAYSFLMYLNIFGVIINLLPIPGIDGFGIISPYLPIRWVVQTNKVLPYTFLILFLVLITPNPISFGIRLAATGLAQIAGIDLILINIGRGMFP